MIYLASDHGGFALKKKVNTLLHSLNQSVKDLGPYRLVDGDDYPDYVLPLAQAVAASGERGIISCRNGQGAAIAANKVPGIRAAVCWDVTCAISARTDDNSNILSLPADYLTDEVITEIVKAWLATPFSTDARHIRRINKITTYEQSEGK